MEIFFAICLSCIGYDYMCKMVAKHYQIITTEALVESGGAQQTKEIKVTL